MIEPQQSIEAPASSSQSNALQSVEPSFFASSLQPENVSFILAPSSTMPNTTTTTPHTTVYTSDTVTTAAAAANGKDNITHTSDIPSSIALASSSSSSPLLPLPVQAGLPSASFSFALSPFLPLAAASSLPLSSSRSDATSSSTDSGGPSMDTCLPENVPVFSDSCSSVSLVSPSSLASQENMSSHITLAPASVSTLAAKPKRKMRRRRSSLSSSSSSHASSSSIKPLLAPFSRMTGPGALSTVPSADDVAWEVVATPHFASPLQLHLESSPSFLKFSSSPLYGPVSSSAATTHSSSSCRRSSASDMFSPSTSATTLTPSFALTINSSTSALDAASRAMESAMSASAAAVAASRAAGAATLAAYKIEESLHPSDVPLSPPPMLPTPSVATAAAVALIVPSLLAKAMSMASELAASLVIVGSSSGSTAVVVGCGSSQPLFGGYDLATPLGRSTPVGLVTPMSTRMGLATPMSTRHMRGGGSRKQYRQVPELRDDYEFDEDMICYCFEQLFDHLKTAKEFFEFEEKEHTMGEKDVVLHARFELAKSKRDECEKLIKRFIYLYIDVASLSAQERVVRLNCVWPVVMLLPMTSITWEERVSWDYPLESEKLNEDQKIAKQARIDGECDAEFKKGHVDMSLLLLKHLTKQIREQLAEIFPLITSLQNDEELIVELPHEEEKEAVAAADEEKPEEELIIQTSPPPPTVLSRHVSNESVVTCNFARRNSIQEEEDDEDDEEENKMCEPWWKSSAFFLGGWIAVWLKLTGSEKEVEKEQARLSQSHPARLSQCCEGRRPSLGGEGRRSSLGGDGRRPSLGGDGRRPSLGGDGRRSSLGGGHPSQTHGRLSQSQSEPGLLLHQSAQPRDSLTRSASMRSLPDVSSRRSSFSAVPVTKKVPAHTVYTSVSNACELLKTLTTASTCGPVDPFLREAIFLLFHPPIFDYLMCRVNPDSITSQHAVEVVRMLNQYERLVGTCVTIRSKDMYLQDLVDIVNMYMDAYDRYTKDKLCQLAKNIHLREVSEASCLHIEIDRCPHTHGPLDLFTLIDDNLDIAIEEHYLGAKALLRLYTTFARVFSYFQSLQLRTLCAAKVNSVVGDIHDAEMVELTPLSLTQNATLQWLQAQANNAALYQKDTKNLLEKGLKLLAAEDVREREATIQILQRVSDGFHSVGVRVADVLAEVALKYVQKSLDVCFTSEWFENHELTMDEIHGEDRDLDVIVNRFLHSLSDEHAAHIALRLAHGLVSYYFNFFVKHLADKKFSEINEDKRFWGRVQKDKQNFVEFFQQFHELVDQQKFQEELDWIDRLQQLAECDTDVLAMLVLKSRLDERFRVDPVTDTNTILEAVLSLRDDMKSEQIAEALDLKVDAVEGEEKTTGLEINVERGEDLAIKDAFSSDPFVKIILIGAGEKRLFECATHVIKSNLNPVWHYTCSNYHSDLLTHTQKILFECWDWDLIGKGDFMGRAFVDMFEIKHNISIHNGEEYIVTLDLQPSPEYHEDVKGTITVGFRYWIKHNYS